MNYLFKTSLFGLIIIASVACTKTIEKEDSNNGVILFSAQTDIRVDPVTKTSYSGYQSNGKERIDWVPGDLIRINSDVAVTKDGKHYADYKVTAVSDGVGGDKTSSYAQITPSANEQSLLWGEGTHNFYSVYPSPISNNSIELSSNVITETILSSQSYTKVGMELIPDMDYAYMFASVQTSSTSTVSLSFKPMFTAFQFTVDSADDNEMTITSFTLSSASTALSGSCRGTIHASTSSDLSTIEYADFPEPNPENQKVSVLFDGGRGITITKGSPLTFTVFALPQEYRDLTVSFSTSVGETKSLKLKGNNNEWVAFLPGQKYNISGLGLPGQWNYSIGTPIDDIKKTGVDVSGNSETDICVSVNKTRNNSIGNAPWKAYFFDSEPAVGAPYSSLWSETPLKDSDSQDWLSLSLYEGDGNANDVKVFLSGATAGNISMGTDAYSMTTSMSNNNLGTVDLSCMRLNTSKGCFEYNANNRPTTANCYVVNGYGTFLIPLVYGNGVQNGIAASAYVGTQTGEYPLSTFVNADGKAITSDYILLDANLLKGGSYKARIVWQDVRRGFEIIQDKDVEFCSSAPGGAALNCPYIKFSIDPYDSSTGKGIKPGNAVIALYDEENDKILWSWHIWFTNEAFSTNKIYYNKAEFESHLNCNLGWTPPISYTGGNTTAREQYVIIVCTVTNTVMDAFKVSQASYSIPAISCDAYSNTYYQYGRKDPFLPSRGKTNLNRPSTSSYYIIEGKKTITAPAESYVNTSFTPISSGMDENTNILGWMIQNPYIFYIVPNGIPRFSNLWNADKAPESNQFEAFDVKKSIYDPSPVGFRLPRKDAYEGFNGVVNSHYKRISSSGELPAGWTLLSSYEDTGTVAFFPACGRIRSSDDYGRRVIVNERGYYFTSFRYGPNECTIMYFNTTQITGHYAGLSTDGDSLRPVQE